MKKEYRDMKELIKEHPWWTAHFVFVGIVLILLFATGSFN